jgi:hypothetical protein
MIERATERRAAGDWRGACAAANVDVAFDLPDVRKRWGGETAAAIEADLACLAPDLMRWHLPRYLKADQGLQPGHAVTLARYQHGSPLDVCLDAELPTRLDRPQRVILRVSPVLALADSIRSLGCIQNWVTLRHLWDARQAGELRRRHGGGRRAPFCAPDGAILSAGEVPGDLDDPAGETERAAVLHERGDIELACDAVGIAVDDTTPRMFPHLRSPQQSLLGMLAGTPLALTSLEPAVRRLADAGFGTQFQIASTPLNLNLVAVIELDPDSSQAGHGQRQAGRETGLRVRLEGYLDARNISWLPEASRCPLPDIRLLRRGDITPDRLHPLVSASLFPEREPQEHDGPPDVELPVPVRVRCRGQWHEVCSRDGRLATVHGADEERRERAIAALGGPLAGCFAAAQAWTSGRGRLPRGLRGQRRELFDRARHGDTPGVLRLLDAGIDPAVRDGGNGGSLLHALPMLDWEALLPRLLAAGLDLEGRDREEHTPLLTAVVKGPAGLVRALLDAGARTDARSAARNRGVLDLIDLYERTDLSFLKDEIRRDSAGRP